MCLFTCYCYDYILVLCLKITLLEFAYIFLYPRCCTGTSLRSHGLVALLPMESVWKWRVWVWIVALELSVLLCSTAMSMFMWWVFKVCKLTEYIIIIILISGMTLSLHMNILLRFELCGDDFVHMTYFGVRLFDGWFGDGGT